MTKASAIDWMPSTTSSSRDTSSWMSSRSNGVTNASSSRRFTSSSISSPRFSRVWMLATRASSLSYASTISWSAVAAAARLSPSSTKSSKNFGSFGRMRNVMGVPPGASSVASRRPEGVEDDPRHGPEDGRHGDGQDPGDEDATSDAPPDRPCALARADAHDRARDDLGGRHRHPEMGGPEQDRGAGGPRRDPVDRLKLGDPLAHRPHDPPPADGRARRQRRGGHDDHPRRHLDLGNDAGGEQRQRDDAHRLLRVVGSVGERHECGREDLEPPEAAGHRLALRAPEDPVDREHETERDGEAEDR